MRMNQARFHIGTADESQKVGKTVFYWDSENKCIRKKEVA